MQLVFMKSLKSQLRFPLMIIFTAGIAAIAGATQTLSLPSFNSEPKYCLMFTVDGMDSDFITSESMPNLYSWRDAGAILPGAINVYPTATTPNMSSLYTGAYPLSTGVGGNLVFRKKEKRYQVGPRPQGVVSLNDAFKSAGHSTAGVQIYMMDKADRYVHENVPTPHGVTTMTLAMLDNMTSVPTLMAVLFQTMDKVSHQFGPDTAQARAEAASVDREIAVIVQRYAELGILKDTMVVITADHGMSATDSNIDIAAVNKAVSTLGLKSEWLTRQGQQLSDDADLYLMVAGNLQGYFNREFPEDEQQRLFMELRKIDGIGSIHDTVTLRRMHTHPSGGDFVVEPTTGWRFRGKRGTHGTNRESDGYQTFFGAGVKQGAVAKNASTVDIMPTILQAFDIEIPETVDGHPLSEALLP